ncbi:MAG: amidase family protein, partial [Cyanobacteria bacterium P01_H01_bin.119]
MTQPPDALSIAAAVRNGEMKAATVIESTLDQIAVQNAKLNCFTTVTAERAMATAEAIDQAVAQGDSPGLLAGVPFAVKNLFDIANVTTLAGAKLEQNSPPAATDATAIARLTQAGAILVGALNMDEYAYGF